MSNNNVVTYSFNNIYSFIIQKKVKFNEVTNTLFYHSRSRQNRRKSSVEECIFDYIALHIESRFNKNSLLQSYFVAYLPAWQFGSNKEPPMLMFPFKLIGKVFLIQLYSKKKTKKKTKQKYTCPQN